MFDKIKQFITLHTIKYRIVTVDNGKGKLIFGQYKSWLLGKWHMLATYDKTAIDHVESITVSVAKNIATHYDSLLTRFNTQYGKIEHVGQITNQDVKKLANDLKTGIK